MQTKVFNLFLSFFLSIFFLSCGKSGDNGNNNNNGNAKCFSSAIQDMKGKCNFIEVKASPNDPNDKRMLKVYYSIIPAINKSTNNDPIIYLEGGPGPSTTFTVGGDVHRLANLFQDRDLIVMDYRGSGFTEPYPKCNSLFSEAGLDKENFKQCVASLDKKNIKLSDYTSANIAYDLNKILEKEKIDKIILAGYSYGTRVASTMARDYPNKVSAMILDGFFTIESNGISQAKEAILEKLSDLSIRYDKEYPNAKLRDKLEELFKEPSSCSLDKLKLIASIAYVNVNASIVKHNIEEIMSTPCDGSPRNIDPKFFYRFSSEIMSLGIIMYEEAYFMSKQKPHTFGFGTNVVNALNKFQGGAPIDVSEVDFMREYFTAIPKQIEIEPLKTDIPSIIFTAGLDLQTPKYWAINAQKHLSNSRHFFFKDLDHVFSNNDTIAEDIVRKFLNNYDDWSAVDNVQLEDSMVVLK